MKTRGPKNFRQIITKTLRERNYTLVEFANAMHLTVAGVYARFRNSNAKFSLKERYICEKYLGKEWEKLIHENARSAKKGSFKSMEITK